MSGSTFQTILVVEDNPTTRKMYRIALEADGYRVLEAFDGRSALEHLARERPALVLQDLVLPDHDGIELARMVRAQPRYADLPIIALSGFPGLLDRARLATGCFDAALVKPVPPSMLLEVVRQYVPTIVACTEEFGRGKTILVVDDDPVQLKLALLRLSALGFDVLSAFDAKSALALAEKRLPDIVLCDVLMPDGDGYELTVALHGRPALADVPVVLVSAHYNGVRDQELARAAGASALVTRSPTLRETLEAVREHLGPTTVPPADPAFVQRHADRVIAQLKRQLQVNAGLVERSALQTAQLAVLAGIADALARSDDVEAALGDVLAACLDAGGISRGALFRGDTHDQLTLSFALGFPSERIDAVREMFGYPELLQETAQGRIVAPYECLAPPDVETLHERAEVRAAVLVPIMDDNRLGALFLGTNNMELAEQDLAAFGRSIGAHIAQALALTSAFTRLRDAAVASRILSSSLDLHATLAAFGELAIAKIAQICEICIEGAAPCLHTASHLPAEIQHAVAQLRAQRPGQPMLSRLEGLGEPLVIMLRVADHELGTVAFARPVGARRFGDADIVVANDLAQRAALALENVRLYSAARAANQAKDEFLATVSHELRSPLNAMLGWAQLLSGGLPEAQREKAVRAIERNALAQAELIDDLLDMSRMASGTMRIEREPVEFGPIVEAALDSLKPRIAASGIILRYRAPARATILADAKRLEQIVCNLVGNAIKFTPSGGHVDVSIEITATNVMFEVCDEGCGIASEFLPHVFDRFKQADGSSSRVHGGLGLGLAITRHLVHLHGGAIRAASDGANKGARFTVELPRAIDSSSAAQRHVIVETTIERGTLAGLSVLVVDDELDAREVLMSALEQSGAHARAASSTAEALAAIAHARPDVLLSDLGMPGEDGYALIRHLRALPDALGGTIPAVAVSGFAGGEDRRRAIAAGFQVHLPKPVELSRLIATISTLRRAM